jgi:hypothetical protein
LRIASSMGGVLCIGGGLLALVMLPLAPPDRALGAFGWLIAALFVVLAFVIGSQRLGGPSEPGFGSMFAPARRRSGRRCCLDQVLLRFKRPAERVSAAGEAASGGETVD